MNKNAARRIERVCNIPVHCWPHQDVLAEINVNIQRQRDRRYTSITNTESMYFAHRIAEHGNYIEKAAFSLCDVSVLLSVADCKASVLPPSTDLF